MSLMQELVRCKGGGVEVQKVGEERRMKGGKESNGTLDRIIRCRVAKVA